MIRKDGGWCGNRHTISGASNMRDHRTWKRLRADTINEAAMARDAERAAMLKETVATPVLPEPFQRKRRRRRSGGGVAMVDFDRQTQHWLAEEGPGKDF